MTSTATTRSTKVKPFTSHVNMRERSWDAWRCTPHGFVDMRAANPPDAPAFTVFVYVYGGRRWERVYNGYYSPNRAARLATAFAKEVVEGKVQP